MNSCLKLKQKNEFSWRHHFLTRLFVIFNNDKLKVERQIFDIYFDI